MTGGSDAGAGKSGSAGSGSGAAGTAGTTSSGAAGTSSGAAGTTSSGTAGTTSSGAAGTTSSGAAGTSATGGTSGAGGSCPAVGCDPFCPNGVKLDPNGCATCQCNPVPCPAIACTTKCAYGYKVDANGCGTCSCNPAPMCGPVCDIFCQYGNVLDAQGCPTCKCNPPPPTPTACDRSKCPQPAPANPNFTCPDGKTVAGPACVSDGGSCTWTLVYCPPTPTPAPSPCSCPMGQVCVQQIGGPAIAATPPAPPKCETPNPACIATVFSAHPECACLAAADGVCKWTDTSSCTCDNGVR
jgi:hypothetical protein